MRFKDLNEKQIIQAKKIYKDSSQSWDDRMEKLVKLFGVSERNARKWCSQLGFKEKRLIESEQYELAQKRKLDKTKKRFIFSWGQNNTPVHAGLYKNIEAYAKHINASIHIILGRYKNPTSLTQNIEEESWVEEIEKYMDANRHDIHKYLSVLSDVKIQPTERYL